MCAGTCQRRALYKIKKNGKDGGDGAKIIEKKKEIFRNVPGCEKNKKENERRSQIECRDLLIY